MYRAIVIMIISFILAGIIGYGCGIYLPFPWSFIGAFIWGAIIGLAGSIPLVEELFKR